MSRYKKGNPYTYVPLNRESKIICNMYGCMAGIGLADNGHCLLMGDPYIKDCPKFIKAVKYQGERG